MLHVSREEGGLQRKFRCCAFFTVTSCELSLFNLDNFTGASCLQRPCFHICLEGIYKRLWGHHIIFRGVFDGTFCQHVRTAENMRKAYAGWDTLTIGQQLFQGQPMAISPAGAVYWRGLGQFYTREQLMNNSHFAFILFVCSCRGLLSSGDQHIRLDQNMILTKRYSL